MKKNREKTNNKTNKKLNIIVSIVGIILIVVLCIYGFNKSSDNALSSISNLFSSGIDDETLKENSEILEECLRDNTDGCKFLVQGCIVMSYDGIYVVINDLTSEQICNALGINDKHIEDKPEGNFELFTIKDGKVNAIISGPIDEVKMNFRRTEDVDYGIYEVKPDVMHFWNVEIDENGVYNFYY